FWHAVEFSRNGRFLRTAFQRALRALRSFVFPVYQMFSAPFSGVSFIRFPELAGAAFRDNHHFSVFRVLLEIHAHILLTATPTNPTEWASK
ncbi:hypothetical protein, partial [Kitasatospora sp. NPDC094011]|uniref:hypothetical protein n=1 Tax=Kitasatospora sp. NPDC094011 TaxID=3364090 RepID=UPI0037F45902